MSRLTVRPRISLIHPTSNPNSRNAAIALAETNLLHEIITTTAYNPNGTLGHILNHLPKALGQPIAKELSRRTWIAPHGTKLCSYPWRETVRVSLTKTGLSRQFGIRDQQLVDWVYQTIDRQVANHHLDNISAVYAYEDGAETTFTVAKQKGIHCLYDLPIAFYRTSQAIQKEEAERFPELASSLQAVQDSQVKLARKDREIQLADHIFVASSMTKRSLLDAGVSSKKISVIPYGAPIEYFHPQPKQDQQFRALFVGRVGPRKGVHYLLDAWQQLKLPNAELQLIGVNELPDHWLAQYERSICYCASVPHHSLNAYYSNASVFVFPSLVEGFGLVLLEAMACGIPVITTPNTAGPDIINDGVDGFIVPIRDVEVLKEKIEWCYQHPKELMGMGHAARQKAEQLNWAKYRSQLAQNVTQLLNSFVITPA
ncbi:MAG: glycosyltransferase family 4 protein [Cyanothece sp. SIO2G6]|nr:glycosyltransferase family 4 protein [Cyanothece sp. SIO2G6]